MTAFRWFIGPVLSYLPTRIPTTSTLPTATTVAALCKEGRFSEALHMLHNIHDIVDSFAYVYLLQCCIQKKALHQGKRIHALILNSNQLRFREDVFLHNTLLHMYVKCGNVDDALGVFDGMIERDVFSWNVMIAAYRKQGLSEEALALFHQMQRNGNGVQPDEFTFASVLPASVSSASLEDGVGIHRKIIRSGFHSDVVVTNALIDMYSKFGSIEKARVLFDKMKDRSTISWNAMIAGYAHNGLHENALEIFDRMLGSGVAPDEFTFTSVVALYANSGFLEEGVGIHGKTITSGFHSHVGVINALMHMYVKFASLQNARDLFDKMKDRNTISWNALITGYEQNGLYEEALDVFEGMERSNVAPDEFTFANVLTACASSASLEDCVEIHRKIIRSGFHSNVVVTNVLIDMYAKFGNIHKARELFDKMKDRSTISWNAMIAGCAQNRLHKEALEVFEEMQRSDVTPTEFTFASVVALCASSASLEEGVDIHRKIVRSGFHSNLIVINVLIDMYAKFGNIQKARLLFDKMQQTDTISWNSMITGYAQNGLHEEALEVFEEMQRSGVASDEFTFATVVALCASSASLEDCVDIHRKTIKNGLHCDVVIVNALIDMYAKFGNMHKAHVVFEKTADKNTFSWNAMIAGYAQNGLLRDAENLFNEMHQRDTISWNSLIAGYAQNGFLDEAVKLFKEIPERDTISWNTMITGYAQNGHGLEALKCFQKMQLTGFRPDSITAASILAVCATFAALKWGMDIHGQIIRCGLLLHSIVIAALIDMYTKCGSIKKASVLFDKMCNRHTITWNAMIAGYTRNGCSKEAIKLFEQMEYLGISPDDVTLVSVLSACSHAGLVKEGYHYFKSLNEYYCITPTMEHYICMVDLLGRAGHLDEAKEFINNMPIKPNAAVWTCLLGACRSHNNMKLAEFVAEHILDLDPQNSVPYVLLSNIYAMSGRWNQIENIRKIMKDRGIRKLPGCSWIVVNKQVHTFFVGDRSYIKTHNLWGI